MCKYFVPLGHDLRIGDSELRRDHCLTDSIRMPILKGKKLPKREQIYQLIVLSGNPCSEEDTSNTLEFGVATAEQDFFIYFFGRARMCWPLLCLCLQFCIFERSVRIRTQRAAVARRRSTNLATHLST
jgi:hypothetical protein